MEMRLNKWLVDAGFCSRREADRLIEAGKVTVDGKKAVLGQKVAGTEIISVNRREVKPVSKKVYLAYNKPIGIICSSDPKATDNIIEAIGYPERLFHIGRLDVASSGLIFLTNDGDIVNKILRAEGKHEKEYVVTVDKKINQEFVQGLVKGIVLDGRKTLPAKVEVTDDMSFRITIVEGRNRQIRRMCEAFGYNVKSLRRERIMNVSLGKLKLGEWRHLTEAELKDLMKSVGAKS